jgi:hypothetical protein
MKLSEVIQAVRENKLDKYQLEDYHDQVTVFFAEMEVKLAEIEKEGALFINSFKDMTQTERIRMWKATEKGQEEIELKRHLEALKKLLGSIKRRVYTFIS